MATQPLSHFYHHCRILFICLLFCLVKSSSSSSTTTTTIGSTRSLNSFIQLNSYTYNTTNNTNNTTTRTESCHIHGSNSSIILIRFNNTASLSDGWNISDDMLRSLPLRIHVYSSLLDDDDKSVEFKQSVHHALAMNGLEHAQLSYVTLLLTDCIIGNPFIDNKQITYLITTDFDFPIMVRKIRENYELNRLMELSDFRIQVLSPYEIQYSKNESSISNSSIVLNTLYREYISQCLNVMKYCKENGTISSCYSKHDYCWLRQYSSLFKVQQYQLFNLYLNSINSNTNFIYNHSKIDELLLTFYSLEYEHEFKNYSLPYIVYNELLPSIYYNCHTSICLYEPILSSEPFHYATALCCIIYYIALILMRNKNSIKVRLLLPWICPLIVSIRILSSGEYIYSTCPILYSMISIQSVSMIVTVYCVVVIRFFYLRNLYDIIAKSRRITLWKRLASVRFGIFITILSIVIVFLLLMVFLPMFIKIYLNQSALSISRNVIIGVIVTIAILLAILYSICDIFIRRHDIKMKGIMYYLFFDDPYLIRIDLISLIFILILLVPFVIPTRVHIVSGLFRMLIALSSFMTMGGTTMVLECFKMIRYSKKNMKMDLNGNESKMEELIQDRNLFAILKEYSQKEFSLENILLYENLQQFSHRKFTRTDLEHVDSLFMRNYSKYEVNIPSHTRKKFYEYMKQTENENHVNELDVNELKKILLDEIMKNMMDTFGRLQETEEYLKWEKIKQFQMRKMSSHLHDHL